MPRGVWVRFPSPALEMTQLKKLSHFCFYLKTLMGSIPFRNQGSSESKSLMLTEPVKEFRSNGRQKTSLIKKVMTLVQSEELKVVFVDVFKCKSPIDFAETLASAVLSQTTNKVEEFIENAKTFLGRINFGINLSPDPTSILDVTLGLSDDKTDIFNALSLPERIALTISVL